METEECPLNLATQRREGHCRGMRRVKTKLLQLEEQAQNRKTRNQCGCHTHQEEVGVMASGSGAAEYEVDKMDRYTLVGTPRVSGCTLEILNLWQRLVTGLSNL